MRETTGLVTYEDGRRRICKKPILKCTNQTRTRMSRDDHINNNDPGQERVKRPDY